MRKENNISKSSDTPSQQTSGSHSNYYINRSSANSETSQQKIQFSIPNQIVPLEVGQFLHDFVYKVLTKDYEGLKHFYDYEFNNLSEQFYSSKPWPNINDVKEFYYHNNCHHELILALYLELTYRHMFARCKESLSFEERKASWKNYTDLFNYFHDEECRNRDEPEKSLMLPEQWFWDIHEELVYQFQDTCRWKSSFAKMLSEENVDSSDILENLNLNKDMWSAAHIFQFFQQLVISSKVHEYLKRTKSETGRQKDNSMDIPTIYGYFSLISLMRLYTLTGEYSLAIEVVQDMEISPRSYYTKIPACHSCFVYHLAFSYIMLRRYLDASRILSQFLLSFGRNRSYTNSNPRYPGASAKSIDRMYMLLMICELLSPSRLDDYIMQTIKEKYSDRYNKLTLENFESVNEMMNFAQPKLINPAFSRFEASEDLLLYSELEKEKNEYPFQSIVKEMQLQRRINEIFSYANFYHNIQLSKLASLMDMKDKNATELVRDELLSIKQKSGQLVWKHGSLISGEFAPARNRFEFYLDGDVMHIKNQKTQKSFADDFSKALTRSQELLSKIRQIPKPTNEIDFTRQ